MNFQRNAWHQGLRRVGEPLAWKQWHLHLVHFSHRPDNELRRDV